MADSPLARLPVNMIKDFSLYYMHLVSLRVVPPQLHYFKGYFKGINSGKLSLQQLIEIFDKIAQLSRSFSSEFSRQPRALTELGRRKTTELRSFKI